MWLRRAKKTYGRKSCNIVGWLWVEVSTALCPMMNKLGFPHSPRSKDGTDKRSRQTDRVMQLADLPTAPFFREIRADKESSKETR